MNDPKAPRKPCPFCGCEEDGLVLDQLGVTHDCTGWIEWNDWNHRPIEDDLEAEIAALKAQIERMGETIAWLTSEIRDNIDSAATMLSQLNDLDNTAPSGGEGG